MASETTAASEGGQSPEMKSQIEDSYGRIVTSSSLIGGSQVIGLVLGLFRAKLAAVLIGAEGVGLAALFQGILTVGSTLFGLGLQQSGAREIASAQAEGNQQKISRTICLVRRLAWCTGLAGLILTVVLANGISKISLGTGEHCWDIAILGFAILLCNLTNSEQAAIQGTRQIGKLAAAGIWSGIWGTVATIACYLWFGISGVAPAIAALAAVTWTCTRVATKNIPLVPITLTWEESKAQIKRLLQLGIALALNGILVSVVAYITRILIFERYGLAGVGVFSAAYSLSAMFVGFVLSAMGADYYPALTARVENPQKMAELINQQTEVGTLLAFPGLLGTFLLAPLLLSMAYTSDFADGANLLRWFIVGCFGRVLSWPLGYCILALGKGNLYLFTETAFNIFQILSVWVGLELHGLEGVAISFALTNFLYIVAILFITNTLIGFHWTNRVWKKIIWMCVLGAIGLLAISFLTTTFQVILGSGLTALAGLYCLRQLTYLVPETHPLRRLTRAITPVV
jgi:antigen flippase